MRHLGCLLLLSLPLAAFAAPEVAPLAVSTVAGMENLEQVRQTYEKIIAKNRRSSEGAKAALELGKLDYALGRPQDAARVLDSVTEESLKASDRPELIFWRGQAHLLLKEFQRAQDDFESLLKNYSEYAQADSAALSVADCDVALKNDEAALKGYQKLYQDPPSSVAPQALWQAALLNERLGQSEESKAIFERMVKRYPDSFEAAKAREKLAAMSVTPRPIPAVQSPTPQKPVKAHFTVQVGAYVQRLGALKQSARLKKAGYADAVRVSKRVVQDSVFHVVQVGRYSSRALAEKTAKRLHTKERLPVSIVETP